MGRAAPVPTLILKILALHVVGLAAPAVGIDSSARDRAGGGPLARPRAAGKASRGGRVGVFVAGLEGSLHHFWGRVFDACATFGICALPDRLMQTALWNSRYNESALAHAWSAQMFDNTQLLYLNRGRDESQLSYPNGKKRGYPQLVKYAKAAHGNGDMLKVLVSLRFPDDMLASVQSRFGRPAHVLVEAAEALLTQLVELNQLYPSSWKCISSKSIVDFSDNLDEFLMEGVRATKVFPFSRAVKSLFNESEPGYCVTESCIDQRFRAVCAKIFYFCTSGNLPPAGGVDPTILKY